MLISIADTETTGLDPTKDTIVEIGVAVMDVDANALVSVWSTLCRTDAIPEEAVRVHGITPELTRNAPSVAEALSQAEDIALRTNAIIAHNAQFDRGFVKELGCLPWVCSYGDLDFGVKPGTLSHMALDMGIVSTGLHRAGADVLLLAAMLQRCPNLKDQLTRVLTIPKTTLAAVCPFEMRHLPKEAGFRWIPERKQWQKDVRLDKDEMKTYRESLKFPTRIGG